MREIPGSSSQIVTGCLLTCKVTFLMHFKENGKFIGIISRVWNLDRRQSSLKISWFFFFLVSHIETTWFKCKTNLPFVSLTLKYWGY